MGSFEMNGKHKYECEPHNAQTHLKVIFKGVGSIFYISIQTFFFSLITKQMFFLLRGVWEVIVGAYLEKGGCIENTGQMIGCAICLSLSIKS